MTASVSNTSAPVFIVEATLGHGGTVTLDAIDFHLYIFMRVNAGLRVNNKRMD